MAAAHVVVTVIFNLVVFLVGFSGNGLVVYVYTVKSVQSSTTIFIRTLALSDLLVCFLRLGAIYHWTHETDYTVKFLCPLFLSSSFFSVFSSVFVTVAIAVDRFYAICRVGRKEITPFRAKIISAVCISAAVCLALPALYVYGTITIPPANTSICVAIHPVPTLVIQSFLIRISYVTSLTIITIMYIRVYITIRSKAKVLALHRRTDTSAGIGTIADTSTAVYDVSNMPSHHQETYQDLQTKRTPISSNLAIDAENTYPKVVESSGISRPIHISEPVNKLSPTSPQEPPEENTGTLQVISAETQNNQTPRLPATFKVRLQRKTTYMLLLTTIVLFVTWLPSIILRFLPRGTKEAIMNKSELSYSMLLIGEYLFFINNAINPVIYAFVNRRFRDDCAKLFQKVKRRFFGIRFR